MSTQAEVVAGIEGDLKLHGRAGMAAMASVFLFIAVWGGFAQIAGAVVAQGRVSVESNSRRVQHQEGGTIAEILVHEGDWVAKGDLLARLTDTVSSANAALASDHYWQLLARQARLQSERDGVSRFPEDVVPATFKHMSEAEERLFRERAAALAQHLSQVDEQILQASEQIQGLQAEDTAMMEQKAIVDSELNGIRGLFSKGFATATRLNELERESRRLAGESGRASASIAQTKARISELRLQRLQVSTEAHAQVLSELKDVELELAELTKNRITAEDASRRVELRAPASGFVQQISQTAGGVIGAAETLMLIVPDNEPLIVEASIEPKDIDQVIPGKTAIIRLTSFESATTPEIVGRVDRVSADAQTDEKTGATFYVARLRLAAKDLPHIARVSLVPGMHAEVHIATTSRSALSYFLKPLSDQFARTFREG